jgi:hypothetical protein
MDAARFEEKAKILLDKIHNNTLKHVDDHIRIIEHCPASCYGASLSGWVILWAQCQKPRNYEAKMRFTPQLKGDLLGLARTDWQGGTIITRAVAPGEPELSMAFMFEYEKKESQPPILRSGKAYGDLGKLIESREKQF